MTKGHTRLWFSFITTLFFSSAALLPGSSYAAGFSVPEISTAGISTANALVANTNMAGAMAYNPAIMSFQPDNTLVFGAALLNYDLSVEIAGNTTNSIGEDSFYIPNLFYSKKISNGITFGIAVNSPFGLETKWPDETFPIFGSIPQAPDGFEPEKSKIEMININPNFSFNIGDYSSFSIGFMYYDIRELVFNTQAIKIDGSTDGNGWNIGYIVKNDTVSFGVSYKSEVSTNVNGTFDATGLGSSASPANVALTFPSDFQAGINYKIFNNWAVEFDLQRTGWSSFDIVQIYHSSPGSIPNPLSSANNWVNSTAYRLSTTVDINPAIQLRFGYAMDEIAQGDNSTFSQRVPDSDRNSYSLGAAFDVSGWLIEVGYILIDFDTRTVTTPATAAGTYESEAQLFSLGIVKSF